MQVKIQKSFISRDAWDVLVTTNGSQWSSVGTSFLVQANAMTVAQAIADAKAQELGDPNIKVEVAA